MANEKGAVVVTGASTGIGRATALYLDERGYRVFAGVRKQRDANSLKNEASKNLTPITLDVTKPASITTARNKVQRAVGRSGVKALFNNAGVGHGGPIEFMPIDDLRNAMEVNLIGQAAVTQAFLPLLRKAERPKILFTSSIGGRVASPFMSPYNASKFALEAVADSLRRELRPWGIKVVLIEPGSIATEIWDKANDTVDDRIKKLPAKAKKLYGPQLKTMSGVLQETGEGGIPAEKVAQVVARAIERRNPRPRYLVGTDAKVGARLSAVSSDRTLDRLLTRRLKLPRKLKA
jgi:NAD(P)-dependent dehydrogenase (short-subunit alcohol dehydrogenase family)